MTDKTKAALSSTATERYETSPQEAAHNQMLIDKYIPQISKMDVSEHKGIYRAIHCLGIAKHCKPEDAASKIEAYVRWLVDDGGKGGAIHADA